MKEKNYFVTVFVTLFCVAGLVLPAHGAESFLNSIRKQEMIQSGKVAYNARCSGCHGLDGMGKGPASKMLTVKPRDFTKGTFKFKSRPIGSMPTNEDLMRTLNRGIPGTSMPTFALVNDTEKAAIIEYIKTFAPEAWNNTNQENIVPPLAQPKNVFTSKTEFIKYALRGRVWFQELGCVKCHGTSGEGDGISAPTLIDTWGNPIRPANYRKSTIKRGDTIDSVAYSIMMGVDGTPMPAHINILDSLDDKFPEIKAKTYIWELAAFVFYQRGVGSGLYKDEIPVIPATGIPPDEVNALVGQYLQ